jgi:hypothetical protein
MNTQEYEISQFLDYYYPLKNNTPTKSVHYIFGFDKPIGPNSVLSVEAYDIEMPVTYTFNLNINDVQVNTFSDLLEKGTGKSHGVEILWKGDYKKLSGWVSYCLSRSTRTYPFLNGGQSFLFDFDRTHSFKAVLNYKITPYLTYNTTLIVESGLPKSIESTLQQYFYYNPVNGTLSSYPFGIATNMNNARLPFSTNLDFGLVKRIRSGFGADLAEFLKANESYFTFTLGNILFFRRNVIMYIPYGGSTYFPVGINYFPVISAGYVIKF